MGENEKDDTNKTNISQFKSAQQRYRKIPKKQQEWIQLASELIDFSNPQQSHHEHCPAKEYTYFSNNVLDNQTASQKCLPHPEKVYSLPSFPGVLYIPGALSETLQFELAHLALSEYCESPHRTNIDLVPPRHNEYPNQAESMWNLWIDQQRIIKENHKKSQKSKHLHSRCKKPHRSLDKLSWATMGYHYDWTCRTYREDSKSNIPKQLLQLAQFYASFYDTTSRQETAPQSTNITTSIFSKPTTSKPIPYFQPSACIVNYYNSKSIMGGHSDNLELTFEKPVISISMGLPAIFLLGGASKDDGPVVPILIRPGDILMLGGESRLNYHGMAKVLTLHDLETLEYYQKKLPTNNDKNSTTNVNESNFESDWQVNNDRLSNSICKNELSEMDFVRLFLSKHRININIRQVLPDGILKIPNNQ